jgi:hypothetical protein
MHAAVSFAQPHREGSIRLFIQSGNVVLGKDVVSVYGNSGTALLETSFIVPSSGDLTVRVALFAPGEKDSLKIDRFEYHLRDAAAGR